MSVIRKQDVFYYQIHHTYFYGEGLSKCSYCFVSNNQHGPANGLQLIRHRAITWKRYNRCVMQPLCAHKPFMKQLWSTCNLTNKTLEDTINRTGCSVSMINWMMNSNIAVIVHEPLWGKCRYSIWFTCSVMDFYICILAQWSYTTLSIDSLLPGVHFTNLD